MTAKQYLNQIWQINTRLSAMSEQLAFLKAAAHRITPQMGEKKEWQTSRNLHSGEDAIVRVLDFERKMKRETDRLVEINDVIAEVSDPVLRSLLVKRYIRNATWDTVAKELNYSISQVKRHHNTALNVVAEIMNRNEPK